MAGEGVKFDTHELTAMAKDLEKALTALPKLRTAKLRELGKKGKAVMAAEVPKAPTHKGDGVTLQRSVKSFVDSDPGDTVAIAATRYYGRFPNFGTAHQKPNPFDQRTTAAMEEPTLKAGEELADELMKEAGL